jgi:hypothetical protein
MCGDSLELESTPAHLVSDGSPEVFSSSFVCGGLEAESTQGHLLCGDSLQVESTPSHLVSDGSQEME